jgi:GTP cyclohydrolase II
MDMHQEPGLRHLTYDQLVASTADHECPGIGPDHVCVKIAAVADLPTIFGTFHIVGFWNDRDGKDHVAIVKGDPFGKEDVPVRLHSECLTGDALGSLRCDCRDQLMSSLSAIGKEETGMVLYLRQEGRGIGLLNKLRAYGLQDQGLDTVDANVALGFRDDERDYSVAAHMLALLQVRSIRLMTNNPRKIDGLRDLGVKVNGRISLVIPANDYNRTYLETKALRSGHLIDVAGREHLLEQIDRPIVEGMSPDAIDAIEHLDPEEAAA